MTDTHLHLTERCDPESTDATRVVDTLRLTYAQRMKPAAGVRTASGHDVGIDLPEGTVLRTGDLLRAVTGELIQVLAETENLVQVSAREPAVLARAAYLLGTHHLVVELGERHVRVRPVPGMEKALEALGARTRRVMAPFEPEQPVA